MDVLLGSGAASGRVHGKVSASQLRPVLLIVKGRLCSSGTCTTSNPGTREVKVEGSETRGHAYLCNAFKGQLWAMGVSVSKIKMCNNIFALIIP